MVHSAPFSGVGNLDGSSTIRLVETSPTEIVFHRIEDHQLEQLTNISRPVTLAVSGAAVGAFFSLLPSAIDALGKVGTTQLTRGGMAYCLIDAVCFLAALIFGYSAAKGEVQAKDTVKAIRAREQRPI